MFKFIKWLEFKWNFINNLVFINEVKCMVIFIYFMIIFKN